MGGLQDVRKRSRFSFSATALKIHVSPKTKEILDTFGTFEVVCRGEVILKVRSWYTIFPQFRRDRDTSISSFISRIQLSLLSLKTNKKKELLRVDRVRLSSDLSRSEDISKENHFARSSYLRFCLTDCGIYCEFFCLCMYLYTNYFLQINLHIYNFTTATYTRASKTSHCNNKMAQICLSCSSYLKYLSNLLLYKINVCNINVSRNVAIFAKIASTDRIIFFSV